MRTRVLGGALLAAVTGLLFVGCEGVVSPLATDDGASGPDGGEATPTQNAGTATVGLSRAGGSAAARVVATDLRFAAIGLDQVESVDITVDRIEVHRQGDDDGEGGWTSIAVDPPLEIDLLDLPEDEMVEVATEELPAGSYDGLRFFFSDATITFAEEQDPAGPAGPFPAGEPVPLTIPSGAQTGVKVPDAAFEVAADAGTTVEVEFDEDTSVQNITITGAGEVIMTPVLTSKDDEDDLEPEDDEEDEQEEEEEEEEEADEADGSPGGQGSAVVALSRLGGSQASLAAVLLAHDARFGDVDLEDVESITVTVDLVEVHRQDDEDEEEEENEEETEEEETDDETEAAVSASTGTGNSVAWIGLPVEVGELDLLELPVGAGLEITAEEALPAGEYDGVRLFFTEATITFGEDQPVPGPGEDIPAGEPVPLDIPSGEQTGIKVPGAGFTVEADGTTTVVIEFDAETSVQNVTITGNGTVKMSPVLTPGDGEEEEPAPTT